MTGMLSLPDYTKQVTNAELEDKVLGVGSPVFHVHKNTCIRKKKNNNNNKKKHNKTNKPLTYTAFGTIIHRLQETSS